MSEEDFTALKKKYGGSSASSYSKMSIIEKIKKVVLSPSEFFGKIKAERGFVEAFKYLSILSLVNLVIGIVALLLSISFISPLGSLSIPLPFLDNLAILGGIVGLIVSYAVGLILCFIAVGIIHLFAKLFKGSGDYSATYKALVYANTPSLLLGWLPWIGIIFSLYSFYLLLKGISKLHSVSMLRALVIVIAAPALIILVISILFTGMAYMFISSIFTSVT